MPATERKERGRERRVRSFQRSLAVDFNFFSGLHLAALTGDTTSTQVSALSLSHSLLQSALLEHCVHQGKAWGVGLTETINKMWVVYDHRDTSDAVSCSTHTHGHTCRPLRLMVNKERERTSQKTNPGSHHRMFLWWGWSLVWQQCLCVCV